MYLVKLKWSFWNSVMSILMVYYSLGIFEIWAPNTLIEFTYSLSKDYKTANN